VSGGSLALRREMLNIFSPSLPFFFSFLIYFLHSFHGFGASKVMGSSGMRFSLIDDATIFSLGGESMSVEEMLRYDEFLYNTNTSTPSSVQGAWGNLAH